MQTDSDTLNAQADAYLTAALQSAMKQLADMGLTVQELTVENYVSVLEETAKMAAITLSLNPAAVCPSELQEIHYMRKHGPKATYGQ